MKLTIVLMLTTFLQVGAVTYAQKITINKKDASLKEVFEAIQKQSNYTVVYDSKMIRSTKHVDLSFKDASLEEVLNKSLKDQALTYTINLNTIVIRKQAEQPAIAVQPIKVTGKVTDTKGVPLIGATVSIKNGANIAVTDINGSFTVNVPENAILHISYIGFQSVDAAVGGKSEITIILKETTGGLNEVVVVGYGTQQKKDLTGAVSVIGSKELEDRPNTQFGNSIEGKAAGVQVIRPSGQPDAGFSIKIRGTSSITSGTDPLYIVDDVPTYNTSEINPADIESITVLKDASAAAIYGSSGANGVVLITTKHGALNQKTRVNFNTALTSSQAWKKLSVLNTPQFESLMAEMQIALPAPTNFANTNWQDLVFRNALSSSNNLSISGGNDKTTYYISGSYVNQEGIIINNNVGRATFKVNLDHKVSDIFKVGTNISYDRWSDVNVLENNPNGVITRMLTTVPIIGVWNPLIPTQYAVSPVAPVDVENPVSVAYQPQNLTVNNRFNGNANAELSILPGLKFKSIFGLEHSNSIGTSFQNSILTSYGRSMDGLATENDNNYDYWISENTLNYTKKIKEHSFSLLAGYITSDESARSVYLASHGFGGSTAITTVTGGTVQSKPQINIYEKAHESFIGRLNYNYKDKYLLTSNIRADASSIFSAQDRWGYFPSFSVGWRISNEDFLKNVTAISDLKLRAGWGLVGNDNIDPYSRYGLINLSSYVIGGNSVTAYVPSTLPNANLKWEQTAQYNIGLDFGLLNNRVTITTDYYNKKTTNLLLNAPIPASEGVSGNTAIINAGAIENKGFEFQVTSRNIESKDFKWNTDFNIYFNKGKVLNVVGETLLTGNVNVAGNTYQTAIVKAGLPLGSFYGKYALGVDPATGNELYLKNKAGADSVGVIGNANPKYSYGLTNSFNYKGFTLNIFLQGEQGKQIFDATRMLTESMTIGENQSAAVLKRWEKPGDITNVPKSSTTADPANVYPSTRFIENGSYLRVKSVTLGYSLPASLLNKLKITRCMLYITTENLFTFTKYTGFDPEASMFNASSNSDTASKNTAPGVDYGTYPQSRDIILGLNVTF
ncbi:MAG: TonB-dependent receptor [Sphingobacteriales bacterium]